MRGETRRTFHAGGGSAVPRQHRLVRPSCRKYGRGELRVLRRLFEHRPRTVWVQVSLCAILVAGGIAAAVVRPFSSASAANSSSATALPGPADASLVTTVACDQFSCGAQFYRPLTVTFSTTGGKPGGSQVMHTYYTTDGSTPTVSSTLYMGPFKVSKPTTLKFFSTDIYGNAGPVKTQEIQIESDNGPVNPGKPERFNPGQTVVSFTFDDAYENTWLYSIPLLQTHHMFGTYYVISIDQDLSHKCCMSWAQLDYLQALGNDVGGHTITHPDLTTLSRAKVTQEVCGNRQDLIKHGIMDPLSFAYPFGSYDPTAESVVGQCGFTTARVGNGISGSSTRPGPPYAETIPPSNPYKLRTIAVDAAQPERLPDLEAYVSATAAHGGGWLVITFHDVCDAKASDYKVCMAKYGSIEDTVFAQFLDWLQSAGQPGGAPPEVLVRDVCQVMNCP